MSYKVLHDTKKGQVRLETVIVIFTQLKSEHHRPSIYSLHKINNENSAMFCTFLVVFYGEKR